MCTLVIDWLTDAQDPGESIADFLLALKQLAKDCTFSAVTANEYREEMIRDSFINGLASPSIRQRILEDDNLTLTRATELADTLDRSYRQSNRIESVSTSHLMAVTETISSANTDTSMQQKYSKPN